MRASLSLTPKLYAEYLDTMANPMTPALVDYLDKEKPTCRDQYVWLIARWVEKTYSLKDTTTMAAVVAQVTKPTANEAPPDSGKERGR